jgi:hypothetical protein
VQIRKDGAHVAAAGWQAVLGRFRACRERLAAQLPLEPSHRLLPLRAPAGEAITLAEFLTSRVVELVMHGDDIAASVGLTMDPPPRHATALAIDFLIAGARRRTTDIAILRALTRPERSDPEALRTL